MLRVTQSTNPAGAKCYYSSADYYSEGQELIGQWRGKGAARLGLRGEIRKAEWDALCDNRNPQTGKTLTQRVKTPRRVGYDFTFDVPKSVSVLYGLTGDGRILDAFRESVEITMQEIEAEMKTRVRTDGRNENRETGNMVWGQFIHTTARPVGGIPDPHLHAHCFVFNTTWDGKEGRWKAGQFADLKRDAPYFEAVLHSRLARRMEELGLGVTRTKKAWELAEVPPSVIKAFSRRTSLIDKVARDAGITDPYAKAGLGAKTREGKRRQLAAEQLRDSWTARLTAEERSALDTAATSLGRGAIAPDERSAKHAVQNAIDHVFERNSVVPERALAREALKRSYGSASVESVHRHLEGANLVTAEREGRQLVTTREVLAEEQTMIAFAREGRGACRALGSPSRAIQRDWLNRDQRQAVAHVLQSHDRVIVVRGAAGVGKTTMMKEAVEAIEVSGTRVFTFAPSADASRGVLRDVEGFAGADTVARLLLDERLQSEIQGQAIWIDEAGLIGTRTMAQVFDLAEHRDARVILSGDTRQHGPIERGTALRLLEEEAGLVPAEIREIQRQRGDYKLAVHALSEGRTEAGFRQLDKLGWIREVPEADRYKLMATDYIATLDQRKSALVVSPTHAEGERITDEIRAGLRATGRLGSDERQFLSLDNANLTQADRADFVNYEPDDVLVFHQNAKGFDKGQRIAAEDGPLPLDQAARFQVFHPCLLPVAPGDVLRITRNGTTTDGKHKLNNGALYSVRGFAENGDIVLHNGWRLAKDYGHIAHGYVTTSHASQGKSVQKVLIGQSSTSFPASSREQFYVSASRGKEQAVIYTDNKAELLEAVGRADERLSATEFLADSRLRERGAALLRMACAMERDPVAEREPVELIHER